MIDTARILTVPKDIDALMSVGFGMSRSALTTETALEKLKGINPGLHKKMKPVAKGADTLRLILAIPKKLKEDAEYVVECMRNMSKTDAGRKKIRLLGLDEWASPAGPDLLKLAGI